jgi:hypothetical protein
MTAPSAEPVARCAITDTASRLVLATNAIFFFFGFFATIRMYTSRSCLSCRTRLHAAWHRIFRDDVGP